MLKKLREKSQISPQTIQDYVIEPMNSKRPQISTQTCQKKVKFALLVGNLLTKPVKAEIESMWNFILWHGVEMDNPMSKWGFKSKSILIQIQNS